MALTEFGALELRDMIRNREISSVELVTEALQQAAAQTHLSAFISIESELALDEAETVDRRLAASTPSDRQALPPLLGLPTAHKDLTEQRGHVTTHGSAAVPHLVAEADSPTVAAVRAAGAVSIGKTQVPEFGIAGYSENSIAAPARNPHDPSLTAGGSSGGTATAIAAGMIPAAIASDAGGSIRIPAAACGLIGLKPGRDIVPSDAARPQSRGDDAPRMGVSGPMARSVLDAALFFDALLGANDEPHLAAVHRADTLRGLRVGVSLASPFESWLRITYSADARAALDIAIDRLMSRRHIVEESAIAYDSRYPDAFTTVWTSALAHLDFAPDAEERLGALATMFRERALRTDAATREESIAALNEFVADAVQQWGEYDVVLTPALAHEPPEIGAFWALGPDGDYQLQCEWAPQTSMVNVAGMPAITVPTHVTAHGLPMGVQLIGRTGSEAQLLQLAQQLTQP